MPVRGRGLPVSLLKILAYQNEENPIQRIADLIKRTTKTHALRLHAKSTLLHNIHISSLRMLIAPEFVSCFVVMRDVS